MTAYWIATYDEISDPDKVGRTIGDLVVEHLDDLQRISNETP